MTQYIIWLAKTFPLKKKKNINGINRQEKKYQSQKMSTVRNNLPKLWQVSNRDSDFNVVDFHPIRLN